MSTPSKFSLPLPSTKTPLFTVGTDVARMQSMEPLSKAERLLGTTGLPATLPLRTQARRPTLASQTSFLSLKSPDTYSRELYGSDEMLSPTRIEEVLIPPRFGSLQHNASSDALGARPDINGDHFGTITSVYTEQPMGSSFSLTPKSYYDPTKLPLEVSQQTSASAIRDRALRKGSAPVVGNSIVHRMQPDAARRASNAQFREDKKRPSRLDIGKLFTRPNFASPKLFSPARIINSPSTSHTSQYFPHATQSRRKESNASSKSIGKSGGSVRRRKRIPKPLIAQTQGRTSPSATDDDSDNVKTHVRRPPRGAQNWFDGLLEEEDERDLELEHEISTPNTELFSPQAAEHAFIHSESSRSPRSTNMHLDLPLRSPFEPFSPQSSEYPGLGIHAITSPVDRESSPSVLTKGSKIADSDLGDTSILSMSSDDDSGNESFDSRGPKVRDSIHVSEVGSILIGRAQAFEVPPRRPSAPTLSHERQMSDGSSRRVVSMAGGDSSSLHSSTKGSTHLTVPSQKARPRRSGHTRQPSSILENSDDDVSSRPSSGSPPRSSKSSPERFLPSESHKLMAVTEEEEALLEMMRRKRAAMAKHSFAEGYKTALRHDVKSPKSPKSSKAPKTPTKKPPKQYKLHPSTEPRPPRAYRPTRSGSAASSILDSFPVSRSQRSSLIHSNSTHHTNIFMISTETRNVSRGRPLQSRHIFPTSTTSATSPFDSSPSSQRNYSPLRLAPLDAVLSPIASPKFEPSHGATSPSPEPLPSPTTPETRRSSADVMVRLDGSQRDSQTSYSLEVVDENQGDSKVKVNRAIAARSQSSHSRRRTASSEANFFSSDDSDLGNGDAIDPALQRKGNRTSIASIGELRRASLVTSSAHGPGCRHSLTRHNAISNNGASIDARCSVSEDVLAAWGSLGGWREATG
jgi:hypothetical protein